MTCAVDWPFDTNGLSILFLKSHLHPVAPAQTFAYSLCGRLIGAVQTCAAPLCERLALYGPLSLLSLQVHQAVQPQAEQRGGDWLYSGVRYRRADGIGRQDDAS